MDNKRIYIIVGVTVGILVLLALLFNGEGKKNDWKETYKMDSKEPYGTSIIADLLTDYTQPEALTVISDSLGSSLALDTDSTHNYVFIGQGMHMSASDVSHLLDFVAKGNNAFISCKVIPYDLMFYIYYEECDSNSIWNGLDSYSDSMVQLNLRHESLRSEQPLIYKYVNAQGVNTQYWSYFDSIYFCEDQSGLIELGRMNDSLINFARISYSEGYFYLHSTPSAFSNVQMLDETGYTYAKGVFAHLPPEKTYWDEYSRVSERTARMLQNRNSPGDRTLSSESPLQYILSQPPLTWAWYLLLATGLLYLLLRTKRRQRIIPVLESNKNTSLEFLSTIGRLYYLQNNHRQLCLQKIKLFQTHVRHRYQLQSREMDQSFIEKLALKAEISKQEIEKIVTMSNNINNSTFVSENTLTNFHSILDRFYKIAK
ncbi:MAG: hypothetical protein DHS20C18_01530 [Saprospiraceae bacterium]|nr:MAG: hypothetical protein DHS20C18_01530 [Saprospiraceae bacterium]